MNKIVLLILMLTYGSFAISEATIKIKCPKTLDIKNPLNCTVTIKNNGDKPLRDIITRCYLPSGFSYRGRKTGKFTLKWKKSQLQPQQIHNYSFSLKAFNAGEFKIVARVQTKDNLDTAFRNVEIIAPNLQVKSKASGRFLWPNKSVVFTTTIHNKSNVTARNVIVKGILPREIEYINSKPQATFSLSATGRLATVKWKLAEISAGGKVEIQVTARAIASTPRTEYSVVATFRGKKFTAYSAVRIAGASSPHLSTYDTDDPIEVGKTTIYVITARNEGTSVMTNVTLQNIIPAEMELIQAEGPSTYVFDENTGEVNFQNIAILQPGDKLTYKIVCKAIKEGLAKNTARLKYNEFDKPIIDQEGTAVYK